MYLLILLIVPMTIQISQIKPVDAALQLPTHLMVTAEPNPIGVGQTVYISLFFTKPIPTNGTERYQSLTVNVIKPDGTNQTFGPYTADTTGGVGGIEFSPATVGNYTVQAIFPGQTLSTGERLLPTLSDTDTFTVQQDPIPTFTNSPLPTEYWARPIYATNYGWSQLGGNWWGLGKPSFTDTGGYDATGNNYNAYSQAPNSPHIMWVKPTAFGGQVGGPINGDQESQYTSTSIAYRQFEPIILNGIIFYKEYPNTPTTLTSVGGTPGWNALDLRTGQLLWHKDTNDTLDFGFVLQFHTIQEYGTQAWLVAQGPSVGTGTSAYNVWQLFDPMTGYFVANITNVPSATASGLVSADDRDDKGSVLIPAITSGNLTMWNSTLCLQGRITNPTGIAGGVGVQITIRPSGNINYTTGIQWSVPVPTTLNGQTISPALSIAARTPEAILLRSAPTVLTQSSSGYAVEMAYDTRTGAVLWGPANRTVPLYGDMSLLAAGQGVFVTHNKDTNEAYGFSITGGQQLWGPVQLPGSALSRLERGGAIAYGNVYIWDFGGYINAINLQTGVINWTYTPRNAGYNTPYGIYPIWHFGSHSIADGKLFLSEGRMYDPPLFSDAHKIAINVTDGSVVWSTLGYYGREPSVIADGYMVAWNSYDCQIYTFGKGPTALTVTASPKVTAQGSSVLMEGMITDTSPGTSDYVMKARFPNGVPTVSDASQAQWMAYVYMQQPKPTNATGVPVTFHAVDANGNYRTIGTTTSDATGYYKFLWTPDIDGAYTVYASFDGSESYWPSQATTAFAVEPEHPTSTPTPATQSSTFATTTDLMMYIVGATIAIIIAIVVVGLIIIKKRP
jgi:hypothetical protein